MEFIQSSYSGRQIGGQFALISTKWSNMHTHSIWNYEGGIFEASPIIEVDLFLRWGKETHGMNTTLIFSTRDFDIKMWPCIHTNEWWRSFQPIHSCKMTIIKPSNLTELLLICPCYLFVYLAAIFHSIASHKLLVSYVFAKVSLTQKEVHQVQQQQLLHFLVADIFLSMKCYKTIVQVSVMLRDSLSLISPPCTNT